MTIYLWNFLLLNKNTKTFFKHFIKKLQYLVSECQKYKLYLSPNNVYVDFEVAIQKGYKYCTVAFQC